MNLDPNSREIVPVKEPGENGRPLKFLTPGDLQKAVDDYFKGTIDSSKNPTVSGLALALGLTRQGLLTYNYREGFQEILLAARQKIEAFIEDRLYGSNVAGCIFNLKNNFGWRDVQIVDNTHRVGRPADQLSDDELDSIARGSGQRALAAPEGEE